jgi:hypothetical protein
MLEKFELQENLKRCQEKGQATIETKSNHNYGINHMLDQLTPRNHKISKCIDSLLKVFIVYNIS